MLALEARSAEAPPSLSQISVSKLYRRVGQVQNLRSWDSPICIPTLDRQAAPWGSIARSHCEGGSPA